MSDIKIALEILADGTMRAIAPVRGVELHKSWYGTTAPLAPGYYVAVLTAKNGWDYSSAAIPQRPVTRAVALKAVGGDPWED